MLLREVVENHGQIHSLLSCHPPHHLVFVYACVSVVAGVMAGLGRHSSLSKQACVYVCVCV